MQNNPERYRGKRALILTRVPTPKQEEKYSHAAQLRQVREKLIISLGLRIVDEKKHIIHDTYWQRNTISQILKNTAYYGSIGSLRLLPLAEDREAIDLSNKRHLKTSR